MSPSNQSNATKCIKMRRADILYERSELLMLVLVHSMQLTNQFYSIDDRSPMNFIAKKLFWIKAINRIFLNIKIMHQIAQYHISFKAETYE